MLEDATVRELLACARELDLFVLLEGFDASDLERIASFGAEADSSRVLAGVNCRDLKSLQVDFQRFATLAEMLPRDMRCVAESGVAGIDDIATVAGLGYRLALVGSALMTTGNPEATLREFVAAGRRVIAAKS